MKVYEGNIITCDNRHSVFKFLVEDKGRIAYVENSLPEEYESVPRISLGEKAILPSFADTHLHFSSYALFAASLDIRSASSFQEINKLIKEYLESSQQKYILGFGASAHNVKEKRLIERADLDKDFPDIPVMIIKYDGHASANNSKMLQMLPQRTQELRGYHSDTGHLMQEAFFSATDFITNKVSPISLMKNMLNGIDLMASQGIGMLHTAEGVGFPRDLDVDLARFIGKGLKNPYQVRIFFQTMDPSKVIKRKLPRIGGCFETALDGCFGSEDAALLRPYANNPQNNGVLFYTQQQVSEFTKKANRAGLQIELHAIGDAAFDQAVKAFEDALADYYREDHRHTIIHACLPTETGLEKCAELGIGIAAQPAFLHWPLEPLEYLERILGDRAYKISPFRKMIDMGIHISGGSDAPCTLPDPIEGIYSACNHYVSEESITIREALRMFTYEAAWMSFDENERGSLEPNKIADMVILNRSPLELESKSLRELKVENLILSGKDYIPNQSIPSLLLHRMFSGSKKV